MSAELAARDTQRREDACERYRRGTLDIVIEDAHTVAVVMQETKRGVVREILELDDDAREYVGGSLHELVDELLISTAAEPLLPQGGDPAPPLVLTRRRDRFRHIPAVRRARC